MSVDTTILIIKSGDQYRVACVQAAENITDYKDEYCIRSYFAKAPVFGTMDTVMNEAERLEKDHEEMMGFGSEYGIRIINLEWLPEYNFPIED